MNTTTPATVTGELTALTPVVAWSRRVRRIGGFIQAAFAALWLVRASLAIGGRVVRGRVGEMLRYTQTLTLWRGVDRVDCATTIDDFVGEDRLLRLRWPCPVPGAMPGSTTMTTARSRISVHELATPPPVEVSEPGRRTSTRAVRADGVCIAEGYLQRAGAGRAGRPARAAC